MNPIEELDKQWKDLGFDPKKDGYWATVERIKQRMEKRDRERRNARLLAFAAISISVIILSLVCWGLST